MNRLDRWSGGAVLVAALGVLVLVLAPARLSSGEATGRTAAPRLVHLKAGTRVTDPFEGWSHLVVKSVPRLASGETNTLPGWAAESAERFRTAIVVDVRSGSDSEPGYRLERIGVGMCAPASSGADRVVRADAPIPADVRLNRLERQVLAVSDGELIQGRLVATTPTFALYRTPARLVIDGRQEAVRLFYAFRVDPDRGTLDAAVFALARDRAQRQAPRTIRVLDRSPVFDCALDVRAIRVAGVVPVNWEFAMTALPSGVDLETPEGLGSLLIQADDARADAERLERAFRRLFLNARRRSEPAPAAAPGSDPGRSG